MDIIFILPMALDLTCFNHYQFAYFDEVQIILASPAQPAFRLESRLFSGEAEPT